jgi:hypothetical protein
MPYNHTLIDKMMILWYINLSKLLEAFCPFRQPERTALSKMEEKMKISGLKRNALWWLVGVWACGIGVAIMVGMILASFASIVYHIISFHPEMGVTSPPTFYPVLGIGSLVAFLIEYRYLWLPQRDYILRTLRRLGT